MYQNIYEHNKFFKFVSVVAVSVLAFVFTGISTVFAEVTISPTENIWVLNEGDTENETITVTIPEGSGISKADVYFLADTTGSMGSPIANVKTGISTIMNDLVNDLPGVDFAFGAGDFKDFQSPTQYDPYVFNHIVSLTNDITDVQAGVNSWFPGGGADAPEGQFYAYDQIAEDRAPSSDGSPAGTIGWRSDSKKILVVFGDAPAHDPVCSAITSQVSGHTLSYDITEASVTQKLVDANITFIGISTLTGVTNGMDGVADMSNYNSACGTTGLTTAGQATRIANATGGVHVSGVNNTAIVDAIKDQVSEAVSTINSLTLVPTGDMSPFVTAINPVSGYGPLSSDQEHILTFEVDWTGVEACSEEDQVFTGTLDVVADGSVVAYKPVTVTVPACKTEVVAGRMTGGGSVFTEDGTRVTHGLRLECDADLGPNNLQINWGRGERFHLEELTSAVCTLDEDINSGPRPASFNTHEGTGVGSYKNEAGATVEWKFTDAGEPGVDDYSWIKVTRAGGEVVLEVSGFVQNGNYQAHDSN